MTLRVTQKQGVSPLAPTYTEPTQPTGLVVLGVTADTATLRCNPSLPTDNTYIIGYRWYVDGAETEDTELPEITLTGLTENTEYIVAVSAITSKRVESEQADGIYVTTAFSGTNEAIAPTVPSALTNTTTSAAAVVFTWTGSVSQDEYPLLGYKVYRAGMYVGTTTGTYWLDESTVPSATYAYQVSAYTAGAESAKAQILITTPAVAQLVFLPVTVPSGYRAGGDIPAWQIGTSGGFGEVTVELLSGTLYPGATILPDGTVPSVTTTATAQGTYNFTVQAYDQGINAPITLALTVTIDYPQLRAFPAPQASPSAIVGEVYAGSGLIVANGGDGTYTCVLKSGTYEPPGLAIDEVFAEVWQVVGTCTGGSGQSFSPVYTLESGDEQSIEVTLPIAVQAVTPISFDIALAATPNFTVNSAYSTKNLTVTGATGTVTVTRNGSVPSGMTAVTSQSGAGPTFPMFGGTPTDGYGLPYGGTITATDSATPPNSRTIPYGFSGEPAATPNITLTMPTFTNPVVGSSYNKVATAGGTIVGTVLWNRTGNLPPGITAVQSGSQNTLHTFTATDVATGAAGGVYGGNLTATDSADLTNTITKPWSITVDPLPTAWVAPSQTNPLPDKTFTGGTAGSQTYNTADYVSAGSATDLVVGIEVTGATPFPAGVSATMDSTGIGGTFTLASAGLFNPSTTLTTDYRLTLTYNEPSIIIPGDSADQAEWNAQKALPTVIGYQDFTGYADTAAMIAARGPYAGGQPVSGQYDILLQNQVSLVGGKTLEIQTYAGAGQQGGNFSGYYKTDRTALRQFYFQFSIWRGKNQLGWYSPSNTTLDGPKCFYFEENSVGQVYVTAGNHGFPGIHLSNQTSLRRELSVQGSNQYFRHNALDTGLAYTTPAQAMRRYGISYQAVATTGDYSFSATNAVPLIYDRPGVVWPNQDALSAGSVAFNYDNWTTFEVYIDADNRVLKMWAAHYGDPPRLLCDSTVSGSNAADFNPTATQYATWAAMANYLTGRSAEASRPTFINRYDRIIWGLPVGGFKFPRQPDANLPGAPY